MPRKNSAFFNNYAVNATNLPEFHRMYCENMASLWEQDWERRLLKKAGEYNAKAETELNLKYGHYIEEAKELIKVEMGIRYELAHTYNNDKNMRMSLDEAYKDDYKLWINCNMFTWDNRLGALGLPSMIPLVLTKSQEDLLDAIVTARKTRTNLNIVKSRAEGVTDICLALSIYYWLYERDFKVGWGSRKFELVDKKGNSDSVLEKARMKIFKLPSQMIPAGFKSNPKENNKTGLLKNPKNGSLIIGEGGINIGRGGKTSMYFPDEKAHMEDQQSVDAALSQTTDCQIDITTPNGMNHYYEKVKRNPESTYMLMWYKNPWKNKEWMTGERPKDNPWYNCMIDEYGEDLVEQEINANFEVCVEDAFIKPEWINSAVDFQLRNEGVVRAGYDVSAEGKDDAAYGVAHGGKVIELKLIGNGSPYEKNKKIGAWNCEYGIDYFAYDKVGVGEDVYAQLKDMEIDTDYTIKGIAGQASPSDNIIRADGVRAKDWFRNLRAEIWWNLRERFRKTYEVQSGIACHKRDELISLPSKHELTNQLKMELSTPKLVRSKGGKIGVESKKEMKSRKVKSPNLADMLAYMFSDTCSDIPVINRLRYKDEVIHSSRDFEYVKDCSGKNIGSIVIRDDGSIYILLGNYSQISKKLFVFYEFESRVFDPKFLKYIMMKEVHNIEWFCSEKMMKDVEKGENCIYYRFTQYGIYPITLPTYNLDNNINNIETMFEQGRIEISKGCNFLSTHIRDWKIKNGKPEPKIFGAEALLQMVSGLYDFSIEFA